VTPHEALIAAQNLIRNPERWTQGAYARNVDGVAVSPRELSAKCWCASGAVYHVTKDSQFFVNTAALLALGALREVAEGSVTTFNDLAGHSEVLDLFDAAIEATA
jgi:hypothetical protein